MANRRMLSKSITDSSSFLMMGMGSQALYMHLNQHADDDGYCEYFGILRMCGANADDLNVLKAKQFVQVFNDKVLILRDWKENNYIQKDRYQKSKYLDVYKMDTECIQDVHGMDTEVRLGKVRLGNNTTKAEVLEKPSVPDARETFIHSLREETQEIWDYWESTFSEITTSLDDNRLAINKLLDLEGSSDKVKKLIRLANIAWSEKYTPKEAKASSPKALWERRSTILAWGKGKFTADEKANYTFN